MRGRPPTGWRAPGAIGLATLPSRSGDQDGRHRIWATDAQIRCELCPNPGAIFAQFNLTKHTPRGAPASPRPWRALARRASWPAPTCRASPWVCPDRRRTQPRSCHSAGSGRPRRLRAPWRASPAFRLPSSGTSLPTVIGQLSHYPTIGFLAHVMSENTIQLRAAISRSAYAVAPTWEPLASQGRCRRA